MNSIFTDNPLLTVFLVAAIGYLLGSINWNGKSLGVSATLFVGLFIGAQFPGIEVPGVLFELGLVFFVYSIGLSSGPAFFKSIRKNGIRDIAFISGMLFISACIAFAIAYGFGFNGAELVGIYSGASTNTPALAGVMDYINVNIGNGQSQLIEDAVIAYSYTYPMGIFGGIFAIAIMAKVFKINYKEEQSSLAHIYSMDENIISKAIEITKDINVSLRDLNKQSKLNVIYGRIKKRDGQIQLADWNTKLQKGNIIMAIGNNKELNNLEALVGHYSNDNLTFDRQAYDVRRIFVSNPELAGRSLSSLNLHEKFETVITRIRRGDQDMLAKGETILELGDRIRFIAKREDLNDISTYFGDSYYQSSRVNLFSFGFGIALGLLLGLIEFKLPMNINFKLGFAGGPLIVGLLVGALHRTGPLVWTLPYSANVILRQVGLIFILAVIGIKSGASFIQSFTIEEGLILFIGGSLISLATACLIFFVGYKLVKIPFSILMGIVSNQPAILDYAMEKTGNKLPLIGYTVMFPIALILKVVFAQLLFLTY